MVATEIIVQLSTRIKSDEPNDEIDSTSYNLRIVTQLHTMCTYSNQSTIITINENNNIHIIDMIIIRGLIMSNEHINDI